MTHILTHMIRGVLVILISVFASIVLSMRIFVQKRLEMCSLEGPMYVVCTVLLVPYYYLNVQATGFASNCASTKLEFKIVVYFSCMNV